MIDVALRLGLKGGTEVERGLKAIGNEGKASLREIREAAKGLPPSMVAVSRSVAGLKDGISDLAMRAPGNLGAIAGSFGTVGVAAAAAGVVVGTAAVAMFRLGAAAAAAGDELDATARRIGIGVEELQKLRFAAGEADVDVGSLDGGMRALNATLGAFKSGVGDTRVKEVFETLGFTQESLRNVKDASDLMPLLADRIAAVQTQAERVKFAKALGVEELLPLLEQGAQGLERFGAQAEASGAILDEALVKRLADVDRRVEIADGRLKAASATLGAEFAPAVAAAKEELADLFLVMAGAPEDGGPLARMLDSVSEATDGASDRFVRFMGLFRSLPSFVFGAGVGGISGRAGGGAQTAGGNPLNPGFELKGDYSGNPRQAGTLQPGWQAEVARLEAEAAKAARSGRTGGGSARSAADAAARKAEAAERQAQMLEELKLQNQLDEAKARGALAMVAILEEELALRALVSKFEQSGMDEVKARLEAEKQIAALRWAQSIQPIDTTTPEGFESSDERLKKLDSPFEPDWDALREDFRATFKDGMRAALDGDFGEFLASRVEEAFIKGLDDSLDQMADALFNLIREAWSKGSAGAGGASGGGDSGWMSAVGDFIGSIFGGGGSSGGSSGAASAHMGAGRATGGPVYRGDTRMVGEYGRERRTFSSDGYVHDAATTARQMMDAAAPVSASSDRPGGGGGGVVVNLHNPPGVPLTAKVRQTQEPGGGQRLDVELFRMIDARVDDRFDASLNGGRDDTAWSRNFGVRRNLTGG